MESDDDDEVSQKKRSKEFEVKKITEIPIVNLNSWEKAKTALYIFNVMPPAFKFFDLRDRSTDIIQITMEDEILIWNLRKNEEIVTKRNFEKFCSIDSYVDQGISLVSTAKKSVSTTGQQYTRMWNF